jgi:peptidyl-tRNA hydrolase
VVDHVLQPFGKHESEDIRVCIAQATDLVRSILRDGVEKAVSLQSSVTARTAS